MMSPDPDFPRKVLSFSYRDWQLEVTRSLVADQVVYSVWASYDTGCAIAVPRAKTRDQAIRWGKRYVDKRLQPGGREFRFD